ncbi:MAG: SDR family NAD(P)-dependent oxidoreductase [Burkholderiaceae bacterium]
MRPHYPPTHRPSPNRALPARFRRPRLLIVGCGDTGLRIVRSLRRRVGERIGIVGATRDEPRRQALRALGAVPLAVDLDARASGRRLRGLARWVIDLAPPPATGDGDPRSRALVAHLTRPIRGGRDPRHLPPRWVYVSTTGVYGDAGGARFDETRPPAPETPRGLRRLAAERLWRRAARRHRARLSILRAPGLYAADRLPRERLLRGLPALAPEDDVFTNHLHLDDLAGLCLQALWRGRINRLYHAVDDNELKMGDYFDRVADALGLPRPPRWPRERLADALSPAQLSFMRESRRLSNRRLSAELRYRLRFATVDETLRQLPPSQPR